MASIADLEDSLRQADAAGDIEAASALADAIRGMQPALAPVNKNYAAGRNAPGAWRGALSVLNGPLMGFGDELAGAVGGLYDSAVKGGSLSDNYKANRDYARGAQDVEKEDSPWITGITQGMASAPLAGLKLMQGATYAPKIAGAMSNMGRAITAGGIYGGIGGVGNSTADTLGGDVQAGATGSLMGAATAGVLSPVIQGVQGVSSVIAQKFNQSSAANAAKAKIAQVFARDARGETFTSGASNPAEQALARYNKLGNAAVLADAGGQNVKSQLDLLAALPGRTKQAAETLIHDRQAGRAARMIGAAESGMGTTGQRLNPSLDKWSSDRSAAAAPLYQQLRTIDIDPSDDLRAMVTAADKAGALKAARSIANTDQLPFNIDAAAPGRWNMRELDHVKKGLDQKIAREWNDKTGKFTEQGASLIGLKSRLLRELDTVAPVYKQARDAFAGPSAIIDAANAGRSSFSKDGSAISRLTGDLSESEMQAFRLGAFESLRNKLGKEGGQTEILKMWKEPATREKLTEMFGDEFKFRSFAANVAKEARLKGLESVGRGSQTMPRQFAAGDLDAGVAGLEAVASLKSGGAVGGLGGAARLWNNVSTPESTRDEMGRLLLSRGNQGATNLQSMRDLIEQINRNNSTYSNATGLIGSQLQPRMPTGLLGQ
jgi:hypothetical protein